MRRRWRSTAAATTRRLKHLRLVRDEDADNDHALYMLAVAHTQRGEFAEAVAHLERAVALNPENRGSPGTTPTSSRCAMTRRFRAALRRPRRPPAPSTDAARSKANRDNNRPEHRPTLHVVVLAAGKGTRMKSARPKVVHRIAGSLPMIDHVLDTASALVAGDDEPSWSGIGRKRFNARWPAGQGSRSSRRSRQLGTAHALLCAEPRSLGPRPGHLLMLCRRRAAPQSADARTASADRHLVGGRATRRSLTATVPNPFTDTAASSGRAGDCTYCRGKDATAAERAITAGSTPGFTSLRSMACFRRVEGIASANAQQEYHLPDLVSYLRRTRTGRGNREGR